MADFQKLTIWIKAHQLTLSIYQTTQMLPPESTQELVSQIRRVCASIPATIAEGYGRGEDEGLYSFLQLAIGSANELKYYLLLAHDLTHLKTEDYEGLSRTVEALTQMLTVKIQTLETN